MAGEHHVLATRLRPPVELFTATICALAAYLCVRAPWTLALTPELGLGSAAMFALFGLVRLQQGLSVLGYQHNLKRLSRYSMTAKEIPVSRQYLWLGRGFRWERIHTQRLTDAQDPQVARYIAPSVFYQMARRFEQRVEGTPLAFFLHITSVDSALNPVRPLPDVGGSPLLHGVETQEEDVYLPLSERTGHTIVFGTTRVGKTRLCELYATQDIRRGDVVIVFDPKGDADLLCRIYAEAKRAGREHDFYVFHLGYPELSARYNAVGRFNRLTEVSTRIAGQLSGAGNSAAFKEFAWRFTNIVARALVALGRRPDYAQIMRYVINIDDLLIRYAQKLFHERYPDAWEKIVSLSDTLNDKNIPLPMKGREKLVVAIDQYLTQEKIYDEVMDGLRSAVRYDRAYFDKIVASLLPLLEKLTTGKVAGLLSPDYLDSSDHRPIFDWMQVIRKRGIVYVGLDALSDPDVAAAVGNSMFADLTSVAGHIYKYGIDGDVPGASNEKVPISIHADEFNELSGEEFIPMVNKGGGANYQVTAYTQTLSDIEARLGNRAKAGQIIGNFNTLQMLRVREPATAELLTKQLPKVQILQRTQVSGASDSADPAASTDFSSSNQDRISTTQVPMIEPAHIIKLPKGQMFSLHLGGQLWKVRMPLPKADPTDPLPRNIAELTRLMRASYNHNAGRWWLGSLSVPNPDAMSASGTAAPLTLNESTDDFDKEPALPITLAPDAQEDFGGDLDFNDSDQDQDNSEEITLSEANDDEEF